MKQITIYTDGACSGNPGPGGWGAVIINPNGAEDTLSGGFANTTNNRMELMAILKALQSVTYPAKIVVYSDSEYAVNAISKGWIWSWIKKGWKTSTGTSTKNQDLWKAILSEIDRLEKLTGGGLDMTIRHVPGHSGQRYNEMCDRLAVEASKMENLPEDTGYEPEDKASNKKDVEVYDLSSRIKARVAKEVGEASGREPDLREILKDAEPIIDKAVKAVLDELAEAGRLKESKDIKTTKGFPFSEQSFTEFSMF